MDKQQDPPLRLFVSSVDLESDDRAPHVLICIHGIRDDGYFASLGGASSGRFVDTQVVVAGVRYPRIGTLGFVFGVGRRTTERSVLRQIDMIRERYPESPVSFFSHSNGTLVLARIAEKLEFKPRWVFLGASLLKVSRSDALLSIAEGVVNDAAESDIWPVIAEVLLPWNCQATGVYGFHRFPVKDRSFPYKHTGSIQPDHFREWVLPTIATGTVRPTNLKDWGNRKHIPVYGKRFLWGAVASAAALVIAWPLVGQLLAF